MKTANHYRRLLAQNPSAQVGFSLAAAAIYASRYGSCEAEDHGTEDFRDISRDLKSRYGESLSIEEARAEMGAPRLGRPPKHPGERTVRTTIALTEADLARLDALPGTTRADRIRGLLDANLQLHAELQAQIARYCADVPAPVGWS